MLVLILNSRRCRNKSMICNGLKEQLNYLSPIVCNILMCTLATIKLQVRIFCWLKLTLSIYIFATGSCL